MRLKLPVDGRWRRRCRVSAGRRLSEFLCIGVQYAAMLTCNTTGGMNVKRQVGGATAPASAVGEDAQVRPPS